MSVNPRHERDPPNPEIPRVMKATKMILAATVFAGLASLGVAGPGPQYWEQMRKQSQQKAVSSPATARDGKTAAVKTVASAKAAPATPAECKACAECACCVSKR